MNGSHYEKVMNASMGGRAEATSMGIKIHEEQLHPQGKSEQGEIIEAERKLKVGKVPEMDGMPAEMLKYGGEIVVDRMV